MAVGVKTLASSPLSALIPPLWCKIIFSFEFRHCLGEALADDAEKFCRAERQRGVLCGQRGGEQRQGGSENEAELGGEWAHHANSSPRIVPFDVEKVSASMPSRWSIET